MPSENDLKDWPFVDTAPVTPDYGRETTIGPTPGFPQNRRPEPRDRPPPRVPHSTGVPGPVHGAQPVGEDPNYWSNYFRGRFGNLAPMPGYNPTQANYSRMLQQQVIQDLQRQAAGDMNSRAQQSLYAQNNAAQGQQRSLASTQRGVGAGAQMQQAQTGAAQVQAGLAGQQQQLYLQEQQAAQQQLAQQLALMGNQDVTQANDMATGDLQGQALRDAMNQWLSAQGSQSDVASWQQNFDYATAMLGTDIGARDLAAANARDTANSTANAAGSLLDAASRWGDKDNTKYKQVDGQNTIMPLYDK